MIAPPAEIIDDVIRWRRLIHRRPEFGFEERETSALVERELRAAGIDVKRVAGTGIVATLTGAAPGKTLALRADMDGLPIHERPGLDFASEVPGAMHACGHDGHTAMLLGAAVSLARERSKLRGAVRFLFQPAEEGPGGAQPMIEAGALSSPDVDAVAMLHVWPTLPVGSIGLRAGAMTASCDDFDIQIGGRGGHAGYPHNAVDTIPVAAEVVGALQTIASREIDPLKAVVIAIGRIDGGYRRNVVADKTTLQGTIRCLDENVRRSVPERIERIVAGICAAHRASHGVELVHGYPSVHNDAPLTQRVMAIAREVPQVASVVELEVPTMGAEDFAYFAQVVPGCMIRLGCASPDDPQPASLHSPEFNLDERALATGVALLRALAFQLT
ncbi:MAG TPA: amidohydrolase [Candidatus Eremiobacteraceae bacterium]|nr:amidohydrolase [Candidatus Eremiobacteraceae bacterium]